MEINELKRIIDNSKYLVVFTGAGVGTESGLKDFRSSDGLYKEKLENNPEYYLSNNCFYHDTKEFYDYYRKNMNFLDTKPNIVHEYLKKLEDKGILKAVITQNIDGLHQKAGSKNVYELHGSVLRNYCMRCNKFYNAEYIFNSEEIPKCECGGIIKPDVVLYEEGLDNNILTNSVRAISEADLMIVAGTSLTVYPASGLINYFRGRNLVLINRDSTPFDNMANLVINESLGKVFGGI